MRDIAELKLVEVDSMLCQLTNTGSRQDKTANADFRKQCDFDCRPGEAILDRLNGGGDGFPNVVDESRSLQTAKPFTFGPIIERLVRKEPATYPPP